MPAAGQPPRVLMLSQDLVGPQMAGPGIRYWELARVLAQTCRVTLAAPLAATMSERERPALSFALAPLTLERAEELTPLLAEADVVVSNGFLLYQYPQLAQGSLPWVVDAYIPSPTEGLAYYHAYPLAEQEAAHRGNLAVLKRIFQRGDFFLCASERQRDLYMGLLAAAGRLNPHTYAQDPTLRQLIDVVPFGLSSTPPVKRRAVLKGVQPGLSPQTRVILWGGGIWDWLDPLTLIRAVAQLVRQGQDVCLYFPGTRHPFQERVPDMEMRRRAVALSDSLDLTGRQVFFGDWTPHEERGNYLLEADIGVSLHRPGVEARYAFRTRVLDYLWAGLPMLVSTGDSLAEMIAARGLGYAVESEDVPGVTSALARLLAEPDARERRQAAFQAAAQEYTWERVARPLVAFCQQPALAADRHAGYQAAPADERPTANVQELVAAQQRADTLEQQLLTTQQRATEWQQLAEQYEQGRFMRLMAAIRRWRARLGV